MTRYQYYYFYVHYMLKKYFGPKNLEAQLHRVVCTPKDDLDYDYSVHVIYFYNELISTSFTILTRQPYL